MISARNSFRMDHPTLSSNVRRLLLLSLLILSFCSFHSFRWATPKSPSTNSNRTDEAIRVRQLANRIQEAFTGSQKASEEEHTQHIAFAKVSSPVRPLSRETTIEASRSWTTEQARGLARLRWQSDKRLKAYAREGNSTVRFLKGERLQLAATKSRAGRTLSETTAIQFLENHSDILAVDHALLEWRLAKSQSDPLGYTQVSFSQYFEGLEVWPSSLTIQLGKRGHVEAVYGAYSPPPTKLILAPDLTPSMAVAIANKHLQAHQLPISFSTNSADPRLLIHAPVNGTACLAYSVEAHQSSGLDWRVFIDAHTGRVISALNQVCSAAVRGTGIDALGHEHTLELWLEEGSYAMVNTTKSMYRPADSKPPSPKSTIGGIFVYDARNISPQQKVIPYSPSQVSSKAPDSGFGPDAVSASVNLSRVYDYYQNRHNRRSIDGRGGNIIGVVNVPIPNAYWQDGIISLGNVGHYASALDVVGHELTHGVIENSADLIFSDQSGALSEAFSDVFGEAAEAFQTQSSPDWIAGTQLSHPLRNLKDPSRIEIVPGRPYPSRMSEFIPPSDALLDSLPGKDNGGVHLNSTIISHAFYLLAEGLPESIGLPAAERIFYRALTTKLQKQAQFVDCRIACINSAEELFGPGSAEVRQTAQAFSEVEIFDQIPLPEPEPVPVVAGEDLALFTFVDPEDGETYLARYDPREAARGEGPSVMDIPIAPASRPAISRDGSLAVVVTADFRVAIIDPIEEEVEVVLEPFSIWSVGLSPDGRYLGAVLANDSEPLNTITVLDIATDVIESYQIKAPTKEGAGTDTVDFVDSITFTADGQSIYCDGLNTVTFSDGDVLGNWNIYSVDLQTGNVISIFPNASDGNFANPSLGRAFVDHLLYETVDPNTGNSLIFIKDLTTGAQRRVGESSAIEGLAFPDFFGDDSAILYSDYPTNGALGGLFRQDLQDDGLSPIGSPTMWLPAEENGPIIGSIFRRGSYDGLNQVEVSIVTESVDESVREARFLLQRIGSASGPLTVPFVTTGTAIPGRDYLPIPLFATFSPGESTLEIPVTILDDSISETTKTLILSLVPKPSYTFGEHDYAEVDIIDNDQTDTLRGYDLWAQERNARGPTEDLDSDQRSNLVEYAVGSDPATFDNTNLLQSGLVTIDGETYFTATLKRLTKREDISYDFEQSDNLQSWQPANENLVVLEDSTSQLVVRQTTPLNRTKQIYFRLNLKLQRPPWPSSPSLATGFSGAQLFSTFGAVRRFDEPDHCGIPGSHPFWFSYQAPRNGTVVMSTNGSDFDTVLAVYRTPRNDFTTLQEVACDNDSGLDGEDSTLSFEAVASEIYFVAVAGVEGASGFVNFNYEMDLKLSLTVLKPKGAAEPTFSFIVEAETGVPFSIETSEDLLHWETLLTSVADEAGQYEFRESDFSLHRAPKFYRVYYLSSSP